MKPILKSDEKGGYILPDGAISKQLTCARCGKSLTKESICIYEDYGYNKKVIKSAGCDACVQTGNQQLKGVV